MNNNGYSPQKKLYHPAYKWIDYYFLVIRKYKI